MRQGKKLVGDHVLISGFAVMIGLMVVLGFAGHGVIDSFAELNAKMHRHSLAVGNAVLNANAAHSAMHRHMKEVALARNDTDLELAISLVAKDEAEVFRHLDIVMERFLGDKTKIIDARQAFADWRTVRAEVIELVRAGKVEEAAAITKEKGTQHVATLSAHMDDLMSFAHSQADEFLTESEEEHQRLHLVFVSSILALTILGVLVATFVVSRTRAASAELRESNERFRVTMMNSPVTVVNQDLDQRWTWVFNPLPGFTVEDMLGKRHEDLLGPEDAATLTRFKQGVLDSGVGDRQIFTLALPNGPTVMDMTCEPTLGAKGKIIGVSVAATDVTERICAEDQLRQAQQQLLQSEKMAAVGQLAAGVAHEINNPLGFVTSNLHTLKGYVDDLLGLVGAPERQESEEADADASQSSNSAQKGSIDLPYLISDTPVLLKDCEDGLERIGQIVTGLKRFSRASDTKWAAADLQQCIKDALAVVRNELKYHCEVVTEFGDTPKVECIPGEISQIVLNLLVNAGHAIEDKGEITVRTGSVGDEAWLEVADTGKGIPEEDQARIFEPFFTTKPVGKGTGLGLSVSSGIVQKHNGRVEVESKPDAGTTFRVWLPLRRQEAQTVTSS